LVRVPWARLLMMFNFIIALAFTSLMCSFQYCRWVKINPKMQWSFVISITSLLIQTLIMGLPSRNRMWMNIDFVFLGWYSKSIFISPFNDFVHSFFKSSFCHSYGSLRLVYIIQSSAYPIIFVGSSFLCRYPSLQ
jgi:hypothetical protein